ncbi:hypothetical protein [Pedobacter aquatilis]|uniref:hypothetical protein n=1 Tax=Pedobacter aquatilis TaxID=351343 RepID=UPI00292E5763|nr:hypothetical protein [Pedobacter aquatilis]
MDDNHIFEACFSLAEDLMWEKATAPLERIPEQINELSMMTERFVSIVEKSFFIIEDLPNAHAIMVSAIKYLNAMANPPLKGNYYWFEYALITILEFTNPYTDPGKDGLPFLFAAQSGLKQMIRWANYPEQE